MAVIHPYWPRADARSASGRKAPGMVVASARRDPATAFLVFASGVAPREVLDA